MKKYETVTLTNICMIKWGDGKYVMQRRTDPNWCGLTFPGGHVKSGESITESVIREVFEETGLLIKDPKLSGIKNFTDKDGYRYMVFLYTADNFEGVLRSSDEGEILLVNADELNSHNCVPHLMDLLPLFENDCKSELFYEKYTANETVKKYL